MRVSDFYFDLPQDLIAQHPPAIRGSSRMLLLNRAIPPNHPSHLTDSLFANLPNHLQPGDLLILNDSRVLPARLFATRAGLATQPNSPTPTGQIEVLLTEQIQPETESQPATQPASPHPAENLWRALVKPARKVHPGETLHFHATDSAPHTQASQKEAVILSAARSAESKDPEALRTATSTQTLSATKPAPILTAQVTATGPFGERTLRFHPTPPNEEDFYARVTRIGHMPLPPYIHRNQATAPETPDDKEDKSRYQTIYAQPPEVHPPGSAAAPTAGLHFTPEILRALQSRGIEIAYLTLHVGLGTFQPVRVADLAGICLHAERYTLPAATAEALNRALAARRRIIAVGTTTTRTLEHIAHIAAQQTTENGQRTTSFHPHSGQTSLFLAPGHHFRIVSGLLTNFHLPQSTLLMLAAAFAGDEAPQSSEGPSHSSADYGRQTILAAYAHAIHHRYRFYSYGDCMLLL